MDGASKHNEKEKAAMKKTSSRPGKFEATDMSQLTSLPGIKTIRNKKK